MSFVDMIKKSVMSEFTGTISVDKIFFSLLVAFILSLFIAYVYKKTFSGVVYSKSYSVCLILLSMVTTLIVRTISSNLTLSLGMVGALSIIRFRTAIKDPLDTAFMFWAITAGIMSGTGLYLVAIVATLCLGLFFVLSNVIVFKSKTKYLFVLKYNTKVENKVTEKLSEIPNYSIKSKSIVKDTVEITFEVALKENDVSVLDLFKNIDIISSSVISYQNDFGA
ncbi:MAG: DUF4956 domain-containing protein [Firmicutes bacterium]|nr:DUF4956 domain-containing protein [Bacillota bacterium]